VCCCCAVCSLMLCAVSPGPHLVSSCCAMCCAVLCCAVLCCAVLCCAVLCCAVLCCAVCSLTLCAVLYCVLLKASQPELAAAAAADRRGANKQQHSAAEVVAAARKKVTATWRQSVAHMGPGLQVGCRREISGGCFWRGEGRGGRYTGSSIVV
jgi:hypothetical protein